MPPCPTCCCQRQASLKDQHDQYTHKCCFQSLSRAHGCLSWHWQISQCQHPKHSQETSTTMSSQSTCGSCRVYKSTTRNTSRCLYAVLAMLLVPLLLVQPLMLPRDLDRLLPPTCTLSSPVSQCFCVGCLEAAVYTAHHVHVISSDWHRPPAEKVTQHAQHTAESCTTCTIELAGNIGRAPICSFSVLSQ